MMKKSSFLHKPKDMLSKSFKPAKCKMSLKLATSRIKLMKNKKEVQVKQMKRELAQLLDSGQDQTARIRVEHVIREEKMMAAYDLIEIYCELIVARLQIIETQKNCPIDLKEAITSVIFASPRCGDIPELLDVQKHFTAKYGKEFTSSAIELRPDCGVSRMLVEKLSAKAPDGLAKIKALTGIAEEHTIKWDPKAFGESETLPNDLLNGPSNFENANKMYAEPHFVSDVQGAPSLHGMHNQHVISSEQNVRSSPANQNLPTEVSGVRNVVSSISQPERRPSGTMVDRQEINQESHGEGDTFSFGKQSWNMEFKDATAAAQAAAESAERASMAARAAAELSSRDWVSRQHFAESHKSDVHGHKLTNDHRPTDSANLHPRVPNKQHAESERTFQDDRGSEIRSAQAFSSRSKGSFDKDHFVSNDRGAEEYSQKSLSKEEELETRMETHTDESEAEYRIHQPGGFSSEKFDYYGEERIKIQSSVISSGSRSSVSGSDDKNVKSGNRMFGHDFDDDHSGGIDGQMYRDSLQSGFHETDRVTFDESGSDDEDFGPGSGSHREEFYVPSPDSNFTTHLSADTGTTSNSQERSHSVFSTKRNSVPEFSGSVEATMDSPQPDNIGPAKFDDSDGQSSEDETDMGHTLLRQTKDSGNFHSTESLSKGSLRSSFAERHSKNDQRTETTAGSPQNIGSGKAPSSSHISPTWEKSQVGSDDSDSEPHYKSVDEVNRHNTSRSRLSSVDEVNDSVNSSHSHESQIIDENSGYGKGLNFEKLTGGFRQKGFTRPPYRRSQLDNISSSSSVRDEESPDVVPQSDASAVGSFSTGNSEVLHNTRGSRMRNSHDDSNSNSFEESQKLPSSHGQESYIGRADKDVKAKSNSRGTVTYFDSESSDSENDSARQVNGRGRLGTGVSRRTKVSPRSSDSTTHLKGQANTAVLETSDSVAERNPTRSSYNAETPQLSQSHKKRSGHMGDMQPSSSGKIGSKTTMESKISSHPVNSKKNPEASGSTKTHKISSWNSISRDDSRESVSQVHRKEKPEASDSVEAQKTSSRGSVTREDSAKKASHVHPNLPDYDTLAARVQALRTNHQ